jgi:hypothetical protein
MNTPIVAKATQESVRVFSNIQMVIASSLIVTVGFLWRDYISNIMDEYFPIDDAGVQGANLSYRLLITVVSTVLFVVISIYMLNYEPKNPYGR